MTDPAVAAVERWIEEFVVGFNLCPFAQRALGKGGVRVTSTAATTDEVLLGALQTELQLLKADSAIETSVLIHPNVLQDFFDYNDFLAVADELLRQMELEGVVQIASFHPDYQFEGTAPDAAENYTNRSPYPMLHLIREASLERAIENFADVDQIPRRNIEMMNTVGSSKLKAKLQAIQPD